MASFCWYLFNSALEVNRILRLGEGLLENHGGVLEIAENCKWGDPTKKNLGITAQEQAPRIIGHSASRSASSDFSIVP